jgi:hypothetical protein
MRTLAAIASALTVLCYQALVRADPSWGRLYRNGSFLKRIQSGDDTVGLICQNCGIFLVILTLLVANALIWAAVRPQWQPHVRLKLAVAGWLIIFLSGFGYAYAYFG